MAEIRKGKVPSSRRSRPTPINSDDVFMNPLGLDTEITDCITKHGFSYRFINYKQFVDMGGSHVAHWRPVRLSQLKTWGYDTMAGQALLEGNDTDGFIRRGDLVLAIRNKEINEKHKAYLRQEASAASNSQENHANQLREFVRSSGLKAQVEEGYEHPDEEVTEE